MLLVITATTEIRRDRQHKLTLFGTLIDLIFSSMPEQSGGQCPRRRGEEWLPRHARHFQCRRDRLMAFVLIRPACQENPGVIKLR